MSGESGRSCSEDFLCGFAGLPTIHRILPTSCESPASSSRPVRSAIWFRRAPRSRGGNNQTRRAEGSSRDKKRASLGMGLGAREIGLGVRFEKSEYVGAATAGGVGVLISLTTSRRWLWY